MLRAAIAVGSPCFLFFSSIAGGDKNDLPLFMMECNLEARERSGVWLGRAWLRVFVLLGKTRADVGVGLMA